MSLSKCLSKESRIQVIQKHLQGKSQSAYLVESPIDLYYLTGESFSVGQLFIAEKESLLLVDERYIEKAKQGARIRVSLKSWDACNVFLEKNGIKNVAFDANSTTVFHYEELKQKLKASLDPISSITSFLRKIKSPEEVVLLKKSAALLWEGYLYIKTLLKEGVSEKEIAKKFEIFCLERGADGLSFDPIIAFGENSALPHYRAGDRILQKGDIVLIDIGVVLNRYASDMTRVVFFQGKDPFLSNWLDIAIKAQRAAIELASPGVKVSELDRASRSIFKQENVEPYFVHSLGHGIGLEVHEAPRIRFDQDDILEPGMVITIEPGLYLPGKGGVRYEDMIVITETGHENLFPLDKAVL